MDINNADKINPFQNNIPVHRKAGRSDEVGEFDKTLDADALKAKIIANRDAIIKRQDKAPETLNEDDISYIKEHGMQAYVEEAHDRKIEELREKILKLMGITEEDLSAMSDEQRAAIEQIVNNEVKKRLAAESLANDETDSDNGTKIKKLILSSGSLSFVGGQAAQVQISVQDYLSENSDTGEAVGFFRTQPEKNNRQ